MAIPIKKENCCEKQIQSNGFYLLHILVQHAAASRCSLAKKRREYSILVQGLLPHLPSARAWILIVTVNEVGHYTVEYRRFLGV